MIIKAKSVPEVKIQKLDIIFNFSRGRDFDALWTQGFFKKKKLCTFLKENQFNAFNKKKLIFRK